MVCPSATMQTSTKSENTESPSAVQFGFVRFRALAVLPVLAMVILSVSGCDSKVGAAAVVNGNKIRETDVTKLVNSTASKPGDAAATR